jgi:hypothetical protein
MGYLIALNEKNKSKQVENDYIVPFIIAAALVMILG